MIFDKNKPQKLIQACWDISGNDTLKRETDGLIEASKYLKCKDLSIITAEEDKEIKLDGLHIQLVPAFKAFLNEKFIK